MYCLTCSKCKEQYIGETEKTLAIRFGQHRGYVRNKELQKATGAHFNQAGHQMADMKITILEKVKSADPQLRKIRESHYIQKFYTRYKGINKKSWKLLIATLNFSILIFVLSSETPELFDTNPSSWHKVWRGNHHSFEIYHLTRLSFFSIWW